MILRILFEVSCLVYHVFSGILAITRLECLPPYWHIRKMTKQFIKEQNESIYSKMGFKE